MPHAGPEIDLEQEQEESKQRFSKKIYIYIYILIHAREKAMASNRAIWEHCEVNFINANEIGQWMCLTENKFASV